MINLHSTQMEQAVIAALMSIDSAYDNVSNKINASVFYDERNQIIFESIDAIKKGGGTVDIVLVAEWLESRKRLEIAGGENYLVNLIANTPASLFNLPMYVDKVNDLHVRRSALIALDKAKDQIQHNPDRLAAEVVTDAQNELSGAIQTESSKSATSMRDALKAQIDHMRLVAENPDGCFGQRTGFTEIDNSIGGMANGDLIIIGARPSQGKTTLAMNILDFAATDSGLPWLCVELEMTTLQLTERLIASRAGVRLGNIRTGALDEHEIHRYGNAVVALNETLIEFSDNADQTIGEIRQQAVALKRKHGGKIGGVLVDHIGIMGGIDPNNKNNTLGEISKKLKALAKELQCPVLALSQLSRGVEQRPNKRPVMSDLRDSGSIEQDADIIVFLYRDEYYNKETQAKGVAEIIIAKQRNGATGTVCLGFRGEYARFENLMGYQHQGDDE